MGTTKTSGWAVCLFLIGFTILGTSAIGGGFLSALVGIAILVLSGFLFRTARLQEEK